MSDVVILGGGTAGWMTACLIAQRWPDRRVVLVESPDIGIVGVGEGSTPQLKGFFDTLGIAEAEWMPACDATYKLGIDFAGWSDRAGYERYFHPFPTALDAHTVPRFFYATRARRTGRDVDAHPDRFLLPARLAAAHRAPQAAESFPFEVSYGYHFDAYKVGAFLAGHAVDRLGVVRRSARVASVELAQDGDVAALVCDDGSRIAGALFVDCSGFRGVIVNALGVPFVGYGDVLFNDRAVVLPTARAADAPIPSQTRATALSAGWVWDIPLTSRTGNGYVYSSRHLSAADAEAELRAHVGPAATGVPARHLEMRVGRVCDSWSRNMLAVGLAQGFLEPLEATALHLVLATVGTFLDTVDADGQTPAARTAFNAGIAARYDGVRDYIVAHYRLNQRHADPTGYWAEARAVTALSPTLKAVLSAWYTGADLAATIDQAGIGRYYSAVSWHCLMAGYGVFPDDARLVPPGPDIDRADMAAIDDFLTRCAMNFAPHDRYLPHAGRPAGSPKDPV